MSKVDVYFSLVTGNVEMKKKQQKILMILEGKKFPFQQFDVSSDPSLKERMRAIVGNPKALPPQLCKGDEYLGDFDAFMEAVECETLEQFLRIN